MQPSPKINQRTRIFRKIIGNINVISFLTILLFSGKIPDERNVDPKPKKPWITPEIALIIIVILLIIIVPMLLYSTGCLDSTNYYYRGVI